MNEENLSDQTSSEKKILQIKFKKSFKLKVEKI